MTGPIASDSGSEDQTNRSGRLNSTEKESTDPTTMKTDPISHLPSGPQITTSNPLKDLEKQQDEAEEAETTLGLGKGKRVPGRGKGKEGWEELGLGLGSGESGQRIDYRR